MTPKPTKRQLLFIGSFALLGAPVALMHFQEVAIQNNITLCNEEKLLSHCNQVPSSHDWAIRNKEWKAQQKDTSKPVTVSVASNVMGEAQATERCERLINQNATHPSTVGINPFGTGYKAFPANDNAQVFMQFSAKNAFGMKLKYNARCTFTSAGQGSIRIWERQS